VRELYDAEVTYCDHWVGELLGALDNLALTDRTVVILTADHGEAFWEHANLGHGWGFIDAILRVPLFIAFSDRRAAGSIVDEPVRHLDIMPTVLELAGAGAPENIRGESVLEFVEPREDKRESHRDLFAECRYAAPEKKAVRVGSLIVIYCPAHGSFEHLTDKKLSPLYADLPQPSIETLKERLLKWTAEMDHALSHSRGTAPALSGEEKEQLKALGYL
jgi:arylsulfatase A-like enzyme